MASFEHQHPASKCLPQKLAASICSQLNVCTCTQAAPAAPSPTPHPAGYGPGMCAVPRHVLSKLSKSSLPSSHKVYVLANALCYLYRKWDLSDAIGEHDMTQAKTSACGLTDASNRTNVCIGGYGIYIYIEYMRVNTCVIGL